MRVRLGRHVQAVGGDRRSVTGPMATTTDGTAPAPAARTKPSTVEPDVKAMASAVAAACTTSGGGVTGTVR